mmetsp:Transcript_143689/g.459795  ORF Transcript_143689/g.459795 Transcript_143689/m.459795 type:complete len:203 (-) Transcript_143689:457-1065(-)
MGKSHCAWYFMSPRLLKYLMPSPQPTTRTRASPFASHDEVGEKETLLENWVLPVDMFHSFIVSWSEENEYIAVRAKIDVTALSCVVLLVQTPSFQNRTVPSTWPDITVPLGSHPAAVTQVTGLVTLVVVDVAPWWMRNGKHNGVKRSRERNTDSDSHVASTPSTKLRTSTDWSVGSASMIDACEPIKASLVGKFSARKREAG